MSEEGAGPSLRGEGVSPGIASGRAHRVRSERLPVVPGRVPAERLQEEVDRFETACTHARAALEVLRDRVRERLGEGYAGILGVQLAILDDPRFRDPTVARIRLGRVVAEWALKETVAEATESLGHLEDTYIRERTADLEDLHRRLQRILRDRAPQRPDPEQGAWIAVARNLGPAEAVVLARLGAVGLALEEGSRTSHAAILAKALGLPAVVGLRGLTRRVSNGDRLTLDGSSGRLAVGTADPCEVGHEHGPDWGGAAPTASAPTQPATLADGTRVLLRANIEFTSEIETAQQSGAEGIGLYRSEFLFLACVDGPPTKRSTSGPTGRSWPPQTRRPPSSGPLTWGGIKAFITKTTTGWIAP